LLQSSYDKSDKTGVGIKQNKATFILAIISIQLILVLSSYLLFDLFTAINYYNLVLEFAISLGAVFLLYSIQAYKKFIFYKTLSIGYFLIFVSFFVDSIDQIFIHSIFYTVLMEKLTLIIGSAFVFIGSKKWMENYEKISLTDDLTKIPNRKLIRQIISKEIDKHAKQSLPMCLAVIDIDYFKNINDEYGHNAGDKVLKSFAKLLCELTQNNDNIGRWGGEEFLVLLKNQEIKRAQKSMDELRQKISSHEFIIKSHKVKLTISVGISQLASGDDFEKLFIRADKSLFSAKHDGRNKVVSH